LSREPSDWLRYHVPDKIATLTAAIVSSGRFGVQLFFLLSGYLITSLLLRERWIRGDINIRAFYIRRILRIWPLYFFILLVAVLWPWAGRLPLPYFVGYLLLAGNWMTVMLGPPASWASILWSVSIEEQFYLSWPLVIKFFSRKRCFHVAVGLIVVANVARFYLAVGSLRPYSVFPNTFAQLDSIGAGILCAIVLKGSVPLFSTGKRLLLLYCGLALLIGCGYFGRVESPLFVMAGYPIATFGCLALFLAVCGTLLSWRPLVYLGKISYGLYVYHVLALSLVGRALGGKAGTPFRFLVYWWGGLLLTIALAGVSYRWLETPFLRLKEKFTVVKSRPVEADVRLPVPG
jgi:peptidoglycan/LPS O-acetylase OafA/YrhL